MNLIVMKPLLLLWTSMLLCQPVLCTLPKVEPSKNEKATDFADIVDATIGGVVSISTTQMLNKMDVFKGDGSPFEDLFRGFLRDDGEARKVQGLGSGFIVHADKSHVFLVTNYHVVADAKKISIKFHVKKELEGQLYAYDARTDLAVIRCPIQKFSAEERSKLRILSWGDSEKVRVGQWAVAIGTPFGLGNTVTAGVISAKGRDLVLPGNGRSADLGEFFQHTAAINSGNSGGCLLNTKGQVIGINTVIVTPNGGNVGVGFAISSAIAKNVIEQLIHTRQVKRGWIGIAITKIPDEQRAHLGLDADQDAYAVGQVTPKGPGEQAGIKQGDLITHYNGEAVGDNWRRLVSETKPDTEVTLTIKRMIKNKIQAIKVVVKIGAAPIVSESCPVSTATSIAGLTLSKIALPQQGIKGLRVDTIERKYQEESGLKIKDIIVAVRYNAGPEALRKEITDISNFKKLIASFKKSKQDAIVLEVFRQDASGGITTLVTFPIEVLSQEKGNIKEEIDKED